MSEYFSNDGSGRKTVGIKEELFFKYRIHKKESLTRIPSALQQKSTDKSLGKVVKRQGLPVLKK